MKKKRLDEMIDLVGTKAFDTKEKLMLECILENFPNTSYSKAWSLIDVLRDMQKPYFMLVTIILYGVANNCIELTFFKDEYTEPDEEIIKAINLFDWMQQEFIFVKVQNECLEVYT